MDAVTSIPPLHERDLSQPHLGTRGLDFLIDRGLGRGLVRYLKETNQSLITTFYAPAIIADRAGLSSYCVVTDADINRVWAPMNGRHSKIHYFAPSTRVVRRLCAYGVPRERITMTGFPLPDDLIGGPQLLTARKHLARRLVRLDPEGYFREMHGPEVERVVGSLPRTKRRSRRGSRCPPWAARAPKPKWRSSSCRASGDAIVAGNLDVTLVAGIREDVANTFERAVHETGLSARVPILKATNFPTYYRKFNTLLADTDILWTKPSEMSFYAGLGLAMVLAKPVGSHEKFNRRWLREQGVALKQHKPRHAASWLDECLNDGSVAAAAWTAFVRMPKDGTRRIAAIVRGERSNYHSGAVATDAVVRSG